jgi:hypothetical protein
LSSAPSGAGSAHAYPHHYELFLPSNIWHDTDQSFIMCSSCSTVLVCVVTRAKQALKLPHRNTKPIWLVTCCAQTMHTKRLNNFSPSLGTTYLRDERKVTGACATVTCAGYLQPHGSQHFATDQKNYDPLMQLLTLMENLLSASGYNLVRTVTVLNFSKQQCQ